MSSCEELLEVFRDLDLKKDGTISQKELFFVLRTLSGQDLESVENEVTVLIDAAQANLQGRVLYDKLVKWLLQAPDPSPMARQGHQVLAGTKAEKGAAVPRRSQLSNAEVKNLKVIRGAEQDPLLGHVFRGVSVNHICTDVIQRMQEVGLARESKVYEIEAPVIRSMSADVKCPRDGEMGSAYVDAIQGVENAGMASFMLSYTWGYQVGDIADTLAAHCKANNLNQLATYTWICCLCINQHRVKASQAKGETVPFEHFQSAFGERVAGIGHLVCMMAPWREPLYIRRVWCDFEMFTAVTLGEDVCKISVVMQPGEVKDFNQSLLDGDGLKDVWGVFGKLAVEDAQASIKDDATNIFHMIENGPGFHRLNTVVCQHLRSWIVATSQRHIQALIEDDSTDPSRIASLCRKVGNFQRKLGQPELALQLYSQAQELQAKCSDLDAEEGAALWRSIGAVKGNMKDSEGQMQSYEEARQLLLASGKLESREGALVFDHMGDAMSRGGDLDSASKYFKEAQSVYKKIGQLETPDGAYLLKSIGEVDLKRGEIDGALAALNEARRIFQTNNMENSPDGALVLKVLGDVAVQQQKPGEALELYEAAKKIREKTGTLQTNAGKSLLEAMIGSAEKKDELKPASQSQSCESQYDYA